MGDNDGLLVKICPLVKLWIDVCYQWALRHRLIADAGQSSDGCWDGLVWIDQGVKLVGDAPTVHFDSADFCDGAARPDAGSL